MNRIGFITAGIVCLVILGVLFAVAPGIMGRNITLLAIMVLAVAVLVAIGFTIGSSIKKKHDSSFRETLGGLDLEFASFYNILYAFGMHRDLPISFKYSRVAKSDFAPMLPGASSLMVLCRVKVPETENLKLHLAVFPGNRSGAARSLLGWLNPGPGLYLHTVKDQSEEEARSIFSRLSIGTLDKMKKLADRAASCGVSTDWETVMIGRDNALKLLGGDEKALSCLDLQVKIPLGTTREGLVPFLDEIAEAALSISKDLRR
ncbi:MAG: hypothetical protein KA369_04970 [Spirochaetes bacterium]|nr:hypothetical protein [Spirochaetota bacterium]